jgi:hypothetical protein
MCLLYIFPPELHVHCSNFFNPSKKNSFGCAANHPSTANVASSMLESLSSLEVFLEVRKEAVVQRSQIR